MIRINDITEAFLHLIGWQQNANTLNYGIDPSLTQSESGMYYQQAHPLITLDNLRSVAPDHSEDMFEEWTEGKMYHKGDLVSLGDTLYRAQEDAGGVNPGTSSSWREVDLFSEWLEEKTKASIVKMVTRYCNDRLADRTYKTLCETKTLFTGTGNMYDRITNKRNLVGFEVVPIRSKGVTTKIRRIGLQFTEPGEYKIYIFHSSRYEPVKTLTLDYTERNSLQWFNVDDVYLPYVGGTDAGGSWYVMYLQSDLPSDSMAINKNRDWSKKPCRECNMLEYASWSAWSKYIEVHPFFVNEERVPSEGGELRLWDVSSNIYTYETNYGLNFEVEVKCDATDFIIEQKMLFQDVLMKQLAVDMLRMFAYNADVRTNRHSINVSRMEVLYELDGDTQAFKRSGLSEALEKAYKAVEVSTMGIDRVCLPCRNNGLRYRSI